MRRREISARRGAGHARAPRDDVPPGKQRHPKSLTDTSPNAVIPGRVPGIHAFATASTRAEGVDGRDKPGHDGAFVIPAEILPPASKDVAAGAVS